MGSVNCTVLSRELAKELGKKENDSDLEFYHRAFGEKLLTFVCPNGFPEKAGTLLQALHLSNCVLLCVDKIDAFLGEAIVAIDAMGLKTGFVIFGQGVDKEMFWKIAENTLVRGFEEIEKEQALEKVSSVNVVKAEGKTVVDLDSMFNVRGVGTVALGFVTQGRVEKFQKLKAFPKGAEVLVKSIQKQDKDFADAEFNERVGLSVKGLDVEDFSRGAVLTSDDFKSASEFEASFEKNRFCKKDLQEGTMLHIQCRMQTTGCKIKSLNPIKIETGKKIAVRLNEKIVLMDANAKPRVIGKGTIAKITL